jgi:hypothetical protein
MPVAEIGKIYTLNGKKYVACKANWKPLCIGCDLHITGGCTKMMRDGVAHTCIAEEERNDVIFVEVKE